MEIRTDSELGRSLLTERGMQWLHAHSGDPYARLLRAEDEDRRALGAQIRELGPLYRSRTGAWVTGSGVLGAEILRDPRLEPLAPYVGRAQLTTVDADGPALPGPAARDAERLCGEALGRTAGGFDLVSDVLRPVVVRLTGELLAVPPERRGTFERLCGAVAPALDAGLCPPTLPRARALIDAVEGLRSLLAESAGPRDARMRACVVGVEVTTNVVANAMLALLERPEQWRLVCDDPRRAEAAVEETLRCDPPVRLDGRVAREDLELAGRTVTAGDEVVVHIEAANQDAGPSRDPERFDLRRATATGHLCLLEGTRFGAVAPQVRIFGAAVLRALAARAPDLRRTGSVVRRLRAPVTQAVVRFPVAA
uniref:Cytochrome P450-like n=1 Tax=Streptomyces steffisburgensis TaxID=68271 RepID=Q2P9Y8_9ACTN|nr:cytochrome P450-like [Streptomyces steffisburgensis]